LVWAIDATGLLGVGGPSVRQKRVGRKRLRSKGRSCNASSYSACEENGWDERDPHRRCGPANFPLVKPRELPPGSSRTQTAPLKRRRQQQHGRRAIASGLRGSNRNRFFANRIPMPHKTADRVVPPNRGHKRQWISVVGCQCLGRENKKEWAVCHSVTNCDKRKIVKN